MLSERNEADDEEAIRRRNQSCVSGVGVAQPRSESELSRKSVVPLQQQPPLVKLTMQQCPEKSRTDPVAATTISKTDHATMPKASITDTVATSSTLVKLLSPAIVALCTLSILATCKVIVTKVTGTIDDAQCQPLKLHT